MTRQKLFRAAAIVLFFGVAALCWTSTSEAQTLRYLFGTYRYQPETSYYEVTPTYVSNYRGETYISGYRSVAAPAQVAYTVPGYREVTRRTLFGGYVTRRVPTQTTVYSSGAYTSSYRPTLFQSNRPAIGSCLFSQPAYDCSPCATGGCDVVMDSGCSPCGSSPCGIISGGCGPCGSSPCGISGGGCGLGTTTTDELGGPETGSQPTKAPAINKPKTENDWNANEKEAPKDKVESDDAKATQTSYEEPAAPVRKSIQLFGTYDDEEPASADLNPNDRQT